MPKMKSSGSAKKRFELTGTGKIKRKRAYHSHILTKKSPKRKRELRSTAIISAVDEPRVKRLLALR
jgi:large subunit ribosomal protein L35